jgi:hypothetical protein
MAAAGLECSSRVRRIWEGGLAAGLNSALIGHEFGSCELRPCRCPARSSSSPTRWLPSSGQVRGREERADPPRRNRWQPAPRRWPSGRRADVARPGWSPCSTTTGRFSPSPASGTPFWRSSIWVSTCGELHSAAASTVPVDRAGSPRATGPCRLHSGRRHEQDVRLPSPLIHWPVPGRSRTGGRPLRPSFRNPARSSGSDGCWFRLPPDHVGSGATVGRVVPGAATQAVITGAAIDRVITSATPDHVIAYSSGQRVSARATPDVVTPAVAPDHVSTRASADPVVPPRPRITSAPPRPRMTSAPGVPLMMSAPRCADDGRCLPKQSAARAVALDAVKPPSRRAAAAVTMVARNGLGGPQWGLNAKQRQRAHPPHLCSTR